MKTLRYLIIAIVGLIACVTSGNVEAQNLRDGNYDPIGKISANGTVRSEKYATVGFFNNDGTICNNKKEVIGRVAGDLQIFNEKNERVGYLNLDGTVHDADSKPLGKIDRATGRVEDNDGKVLGYGQGINMAWVACYFFFDFFD